MLLALAGLPLLPLLDGQLRTMQAFTSRREACFVPSKLDAQLISSAPGLLLDLDIFDRECSDRWLLPSVSVCSRSKRLAS